MGQETCGRSFGDGPGASDQDVDMTPDSPLEYVRTLFREMGEDPLEEKYIKAWLKKLHELVEERNVGEMARTTLILTKQALEFLEGNRDRLPINNECVDIVISAHGSIGRCHENYPSRVPSVKMEAECVVSGSDFFNSRSLDKLIFYNPWCTSVDDKVVCSIVRGDIKPSKRLFEERRPDGSKFADGRVAHPHQLTNLPDDFNIITNDNKKQVLMPSVWIRPITENELAHLQGMVANNSTRLCWYHERDGAVQFSTPLCNFATAVGFALDIFGRRYGRNLKLNLHFAACLNWPGKPQDFPDKLSGVMQYKNAKQDLCDLNGNEIRMTLKDYVSQVGT